jgi:hypothetical protein
LTYADVRSDRIDVFAQKALLRMSKNPAMSAYANEMAAAVKSGRLGGIYKEDEKVPALRARKMNSSWWLIIPKGEDAVLFLDPEKPKTGIPIIVFRDSVRSLPQRLDPALFKAWQTYKIWKQTTQGQTYPVKQCGTITPNGVVMAKAFSGKPLSNLAPPILCQVNGGTSGKLCPCSPERSACPCPDGMCQLSDKCKLKCPDKPLVKRLSFQEMWDLTIRHYYCELPNECKHNPCPSSEELLKVFSPELLIAIFWEETGFRNIPQLGKNSCGPAVGFGQVQGPTPENGKTISSISRACNFCKTKPWKPQEILCDDGKSIKIAGMALWQLFCASDPKLSIEIRKLNALHGYAGWFKKPDWFKKSLAEWKTERGAIIQNWLKCEKHLQEICKGEKPLTQDCLAAALRKAKDYKSAVDDSCVFPNGQLPSLSYSCGFTSYCQRECESQFKECLLSRQYDECVRRKNECLADCGVGGVLV